MTIVRTHRKRHNFSIIDNSGAQDLKLSWKARGLLWHLLTKPDDWTVRMSDLINQSDKDGRDSVRSAFKELEAEGYAFRCRVRSPQGTFDWQTEVFETREDAEEWKKTHGHHSGFSVDGVPVSGEPVDILNTELLTTELQNTFKAKPRAGCGTQPLKLERAQAERGLLSPTRDFVFFEEGATSGKASGTAARGENVLEFPVGEKDQKTPNPLVPPSPLPPSSGKLERIPPVCKIDRHGWLQMPRNGSAKARQMAVRRMQYQLVDLLASPGIVWGTDRRGCLMMDGNQMYVAKADDCLEFEPGWENEIFTQDDHYKLRTLRDVAYDRHEITQEDYNRKLLYYYQSSVAFLQSKEAHKAHTVPLPILFPEDEILAYQEKVS